MPAKREMVESQPVLTTSTLPFGPDGSATAQSQTGLLKQIIREAKAGSYESALQLSARAIADDPLVANARGVCLMRMKQYDDAVALFRWLVLNPGQTWVRSDRPTYFLTNFATALLLVGNVDGCLHVLRQIRNETPRARQIREAIARHEATLTFWEKLEWWINRTVTPSKTVSFDFAPGEFGPLEQYADSMLPGAENDAVSSNATDV